MRIFSTGWSEGFDGPGQRWVVYLKGCNFRCPWCANPESLSAEPELLFYSRRGKYTERACPLGAVEQSGDGLGLNRGLCMACPERPCITQWRHPAFELAGQEMPVAEIVAQARRQKPFWAGEGGVTFGGGEPTLQAGELAAAVEALHGEEIHVAIETNASSPSLPQFFGKVDLMICDLKCVSPDLHLRWTGCDNKTVLENLRLAAARQPDLWIRVPLVPGLNDRGDEMDRIASFLGGLAKRHDPLPVEVLRMHHGGEPKWAALGREYRMSDVTPPPVATARSFADKLRGVGLAATTGG